MNGSEFTNRIAITNHELRWLTTIFHILGRSTNSSKVSKVIVFANRGVTLDHSMRSNLSASANFDMRTNHRVGTNLDITGNLCFAVHYSRYMNLGHHAPFERTAQVILASAAISPSTVAWTANL